MSELDIEGELYSNKNKSSRQNSGVEKEKRAMFDGIGVEVRRSFPTTYIVLLF